MPKIVKDGITYFGFTTNGYSYSTIEHAIGNWIDGKTLYEKTCIYENITQRPTDWVDLETFSSISEMINIEGFMDTSNGQRILNQYYVRFSFTNNILKYYAKELAAGNGDITVTIRYTKST